MHLTMSINCNHNHTYLSYHIHIVKNSNTATTYLPSNFRTESYDHKAVLSGSYMVIAVAN